MGLDHAHKSLLPKAIRNHLYGTGDRTAEVTGEIGGIWITTSGTPSCAISTACAWCSWCGANPLPRGVCLPCRATNKDRAARTVKVAFLKHERFIDPQAGTPEQDDQGAEAVAVGAITNGSHDGDDLLDCWQVSRVLLALVRWWAASVVAGHGRW